VLHHVGGEEVALAQDVQGGEEGEGGDQDGAVEGRHLPPAEVAGALRAEGSRGLPAGGRAPEPEEPGPQGPGGQGVEDDQGQEPQDDVGREGPAQPVGRGRGGDGWARDRHRLD
jgi:hypothetical protein